MNNFSKLTNEQLCMVYKWSQNSDYDEDSILTEMEVQSEIMKRCMPCRGDGYHDFIKENKNLICHKCKEDFDFIFSCLRN